MNPTEYLEIVQFLSNEIIPERLSSATANAKYNFRRRASSFSIDECSKLFKGVDIKGVDKQLEVPKRHQLEEIMYKFHDDAGHPGIKSTVEGVKQQYDWDGLPSDTREYVSACDKCQKTTQPRRRLQSAPTRPTRKPWMRIGMDLICDLDESQEGYKHILVTVCSVSKYVVVRPLTSKSTAEVTKNLKEIYLDFGLPKVIQHNQGKEFTSKKFQEFNQKLGIDDRSSHAHSPMSNGLVEARSRTLKLKLNKMGLQTGKHWSELLKSAVSAMNSTFKRSNNQTPFKMMWGRESRYVDLLSFLNTLKSLPEEEDL